MARTMNHPAGPTTIEERAAWFERASRDTSSVRFTIYEQGSWRAIGMTNLLDIDLHQGTAELGQMIGEAEARGRGLGTEATCMMRDYTFQSLGPHKLMLRVYDYNQAGIQAYQKAGFRESGPRCQSHWFAGQRRDEIYMECLASEFPALVPE